MRLWALVLLVTACGKDAKQTPPAPSARKDAGAAAAAADAAPALPAVKADAYPDFAAALKAIIPADARVVGFGEVHSRTDRAQVKSALARFTGDGLPAIQDKLSDLIIETWIVDPKCGQQAKTATAEVEIKVRRPQETKSEIAILAEAARAQKIQPHAMKLTCDDYKKVAPEGGQVQTEVMFDLITKELRRIAGEAVQHRDKEPGHKPWIALYGGALHNDRFPDPALKQWSYATDVDQDTGNKFVEVDLIVPELAEADPAVQKQPWFPLLAGTEPTVRVYERGERSFVVVFPRSK